MVRWPGRDYCPKCGSRVWWFHTEETKPSTFGITGKAAPICLSCNHIMCTECGKKELFDQEMAFEWKYQVSFSNEKCTGMLIAVTVS